MENGYVILENAIPPLLIDKAALDLDRAYAGGFPDLKFECHAVSPDHIPWQPEINPHPAKALDIHHFSPAIRDLMFADAITEFLGLIFEAKALASQTWASCAVRRRRFARIPPMSPTRSRASSPRLGPRWRT